MEVGDSEDQALWKGFPTSLEQRGLHGVYLSGGSMAKLYATEAHDLSK